MAPVSMAPASRSGSKPGRSPIAPNASGFVLVAAATLLITSCAVTATTAAPPAYPASSLEWNVDRPGSDYRSFELATPSPETCQATCMNEAACVAFTHVSPGVQGPNARCLLKNAVPPAQPAACCVSGTKYTSAPPPAAPPPAGPPPPPQASWQGTPTTPPPAAPPPAAAPPPPGWQGAPTTPPPAPPPAAPPPPPGWQGTPTTPPPAPPPPPPSGWQGKPTTPPPAPAAGQWEPQTDRPGSDYRSFDLRAPRPETCRDTCWSDPQCRAFTYVRPGVQGPNARCALKNVVPPARPADCCLSGVKK
jgi:1-phosphatidylinositol phosphodiesterase